MTDDVAIVGAGPAGSWAAYCLARRGARVTIFDASHPREKPCGGGVTGRALALTSPALTDRQVLCSYVRAARFLDSASGRSEVIRLDVPGAAFPPDLIVASRRAYDGALLAAAREAGAGLVTSRVTDISIAASGVTMATTGGRRHADFVVGADGANSLVRRRLARPFRRDELSMATGYFAHGATSAEIVIEIVSDPPGYIWSFPRPDHLAIGICAQADVRITTELMRRRTAAWIAATGIADGARLQPYSWPIPSLGRKSLDRLDVAGERWCLIGDAAGLVDPITREGIYFALLSGQWTADALASGRALHAYTSRIRDHIVPELMRAAELKASFFQPSFSRLLMEALRESAGVRAVMADLVAGRQSYAGLKWRLLKTGELGLAWRALMAVRRPCHAL